MSEIYLAAAIALFALGGIVYLIIDILANHAMEDQIKELRRENKALKRKFEKSVEETAKKHELILFSLREIESRVNQNAEY